MAGKKEISCCHVGNSAASKMSEYDHVVKGALKLKFGSKIKKNKKKKDSDKKSEAKVRAIEEAEQSAAEKRPVIQRTKAELAFLKQQEKMQEERIKRKAEKTHKQRVEDFNRHLDSLTEHFDIPKVSWTK